MSGSRAHREIEIKLPISGAAAGRRMLRQAGFRVARRRVFESNVILDRAGELRSAGALLRVREVNGRGLLTYKGPADAGKHKSREEIEVPLESPSAMCGILGHIGFLPAFRYEKFRTEFTDGSGLVTLDETPIGAFLELEGEPAWIDGAAARLGFTESDYLTASYARLYFDFCRQRGLPAADMIFVRVV